MMFGFGKARKQNRQPVAFDPACQRAAIRCSICTGEQVAGFRDIRTGQFEEVMLIRGEADLQRFMAQYGVREVVKFY